MGIWSVAMWHAGMVDDDARVVVTRVVVRTGFSEAPDWLSHFVVRFEPCTSGVVARPEIRVAECTGPAGGTLDPPLYLSRELDAEAKLVAVSRVEAVGGEVHFHVDFSGYILSLRPGSGPRMLPFSTLAARAA